MDFYERRYNEANEQKEYLMSKIREITFAPADQMRDIAWEAFFHIIDQSFKPIESETDLQKARGDAA